MIKYIKKLLTYFKWYSKEYKRGTMTYYKNSLGKVIKTTFEED